MKISLLSLVGGLVLALAGCGQPTPESLGLVPLPADVQVTGGSFTLGANKATIEADPGLRGPAEYLSGALRRSTGREFPLNLGKTGAREGSIHMRAFSEAFKPGSYRLTVTRRSVLIEAGDPAGGFYAVQTLLQLFPPEVFGSHVTARSWSATCVRIRDEPRFAWRGLLLDVARHFFTKEELKRFIDLMALHKLNSLQLHLTDDQGWRIAIQKYPRLTEIGAWRKGIGFGLPEKSSSAYGPDGRYGGFYTPKDIREIVAYAAERQVTIVPEIEMPGHAGAALAAYPQFSCPGEAASTEGGPMGIFCPSDETFGFLGDVLGEVMDLFPGQYIHIGGDEVAKDNWRKCEKCQALMKREGLKTERELQSYFIRRVEKIIRARGRTLVGWSEIMEGGLAPNAVLMDWIGGALEAASSGHPVVLSPTTHAYFDYY